MDIFTVFTKDNIGNKKFNEATKYFHATSIQFGQMVECSFTN